MYSLNQPNVEHWYSYKHVKTTNFNDILIVDNSYWMGDPTLCSSSQEWVAPHIATDSAWFPREAPAEGCCQMPQVVLGKPLD